MISQGRSAKEMAFALQLSVKTVEFHKSNIKRKLGLRTVADLAKYALRTPFPPG